LDEAIITWDPIEHVHNEGVFVDEVC